MSQIKRIDTEKTLTDLVNSYNKFLQSDKDRERYMLSIVQEQRSLIDNLKHQIKELADYNKMVVFHLNHSQLIIEILVKKCLDNDITVNKSTLDDAFRINLGIDSSYKPTGICTVTHYN